MGRAPPGQHALEPAPAPMPPGAIPQSDVMTPQHGLDEATKAKLLLLLLALTWGLSWPIMKIALDEIPPFSFRAGTSGLAALALFAIAFAQHRNVRIKRPVARVHLAVAGFLNVGVFTLGSAFSYATSMLESLPR